MLCPSLMWYMNAENDMTWDYEIEDAYKNLSLVMSPYTKGMNAEARQSPANIVGLYLCSRMADLLQNPSDLKLLFL